MKQVFVSFPFLFVKMLVHFRNRLPSLPSKAFPFITAACLPGLFYTLFFRKSQKIPLEKNLYKLFLYVRDEILMAKILIITANKFCTINYFTHPP